MVRSRVYEFALEVDFEGEEVGRGQDARGHDSGAGGEAVSSGVQKNVARGLLGMSERVFACNI